VPDADFNSRGDGNTGIVEAVVVDVEIIRVVDGLVDTPHAASRIHAINMGNETLVARFYHLVR